MAFTFDSSKKAKNIAERGLSFERVAEMEWETALLAEDIRHDYGETRVRVFAFLEGRLHIAVVSPRGENLRVISFRKASHKEEALYEKERHKLKTS